MKFKKHSTDEVKTMSSELYKEKQDNFKVTFQEDEYI